MALLKTLKLKRLHTDETFVKSSNAVEICFDGMRGFFKIPKETIKIHVQFHDREAKHRVKVEDSEYNRELYNGRSTDFLRIDGVHKYMLDEPVIYVRKLMKRKKLDALYAEVYYE